MSKERFKCYYCSGIENIIVEDTINNETYIEDNIVNLLNKQDQQITELEEQLKKSLKSNNDLLKQIMELETQLIKERLKGE